MMKPVKISVGMILAVVVAATLLAGCASPEAQEKKQRDADYHNAMGLAFLKEGKIQLAYVEFHTALKEEPGNKEFLYNLGIVNMQLEEFGEARDLFLKALKADSGYSDAWNNLGVCYSQLGEWKLAIEAFRKAISNPLYRTPEKAYYSLGMAYYRMGDHAKALDAFKDSIKRDRTFMLPYYGLALALNRLGQYSDAADVMDRAIQIDPSFQGNRDLKREELKQRLYTAKGEDEKDLRDYLEIMNY